MNERYQPQQEGFGYTNAEALGKAEAKGHDTMPLFAKAKGSNFARSRVSEKANLKAAEERFSQPQAELADTADQAVEDSANPTLSKKAIALGLGIAAASIVAIGVTTKEQNNEEAQPPTPTEQIQPLDR